MVSVDVVLMMSTGARGPVWVDSEAQLAADAEEESQRGKAFSMLLRDIAMSEYDVWGERMLGRRWKGSCSCSKTWLYSSAVTMPVECFFWCPRALWGERVVRKYWARSVRGMVGRQDDVFQDEGVWVGSD